MFLIREDVAASLVTMREAIDLVEAMFADFHREEATVFPVAIGRGPDAGCNFGIKSGVFDKRRIVGAKIGTYWPGNKTQGQPAHASTTVLLDPDTGLPMALIGASHLTALRTAASDGAAIRHLSRPDSRSLAVIGDGHQAWFEIAAAIEVRPIDRIRIWSRRREDAEHFAARVREHFGMADCAAADLAEAVRSADIVVTATTARDPLVEAAWVRPGTHISAMGSDGRGKQELHNSLIAGACLFADVVAQSVSLGDFEGTYEGGMISRESITPIGAVIAGAAPGRPSRGAITIYDSSGMALQDLVMGARVLELAMAQRLAVSVDFNAGGLV